MEDFISLEKVCQEKKVLAIVSSVKGGFLRMKMVCKQDTIKAEACQMVGIKVA